MNSLNYNNSPDVFEGFGGKREINHSAGKYEYVSLDSNFWSSGEYENFLRKLSLSYPPGSRVRFIGKQWIWEKQELITISFEGIMGGMIKKFEDSPWNIELTIADKNGEKSLTTIPPTFYLEGFSIEKL